MQNRCAGLFKHWYLEELVCKSGCFESDTSITNNFNSRYAYMSCLVFGEAAKAVLFNSIIF